MKCSLSCPTISLWLGSIVIISFYWGIAGRWNVNNVYVPVYIDNRRDNWVFKMRESPDPRDINRQKYYSILPFWKIGWTDGEVWNYDVPPEVWVSLSRTPRLIVNILTQSFHVSIVYNPTPVCSYLLGLAWEKSHMHTSELHTCDVRMHGQGLMYVVLYIRTYNGCKYVRTFWYSI